MAKKKAKKKANAKSASGGRAFNVMLNQVRDKIDAVSKTIQLGKQYAGRRAENVKEVAHADAILASLSKARALALRDCCHNDQSCTLFFVKASR